MYYKVSARCWNQSFRDRFGENEEGLHILSDMEVVEAILKFGRAEITIIEDGDREIVFHNDYD